MKSQPIPLRTAAVLSALAVLAGCTSHDLAASAARPGKYNLYNCDQLNMRGGQLARRERELQELMQKAAQGPGGEIAIAIAYKSEYGIVQSDLREIDTAGAGKNCVLKYRSMSEQAVR